MNKKETASKKRATSKPTSKRPRRTFSNEYKIEAVKMVTGQGYKVAEVVRNLGVNVNQIHRWIREFDKATKPNELWVSLKKRL